MMYRFSIGAISTAILLCCSSVSFAAVTGPVTRSATVPQTLSQQSKPEVACELKVKERYEYYDLDGRDIGDLSRQINHNGTRWNDGRTYAAVTSWDIHYGYDVSNDDGKCAVKSVKTDVEIVYRLPRWTRLGSDPKMDAVWEKYMAHLKRHEFGHKDIAVQTAGEINEILASLGSYSNESDLEKEATRLTEEKLQRLKESQIGYDHDTRHGETQGAVLAAE
jgi:predicted secreted Zn-dependent protease